MAHSTSAMVQRQVQITAVVLLVYFQYKAVHLDSVVQGKEISHSREKNCLDDCPSNQSGSQPDTDTNERSNKLIISYDDRILLYDLMMASNAVIYETTRRNIKGVAFDNSVLYVSFGEKNVLQLYKGNGWMKKETNFDTKGQIYDLHWDFYGEQLYGLIQFSGAWTVARLYFGKQKINILGKMFSYRPSHFEVDSIHGYTYFSVDSDEADDKGLFRIDVSSTGQEEKLSQALDSRYNTFSLEITESRIIFPGTGPNFFIISIPENRLSNVSLALNHEIGPAQQLFVQKNEVFWSTDECLHYFKYDQSSTLIKTHIQTDFQQTSRSLVAFHVFENTLDERKVHEIPPQNLQVLMGDDKASITWNDHIFSESKRSNLKIYVKVNDTGWSDWRLNSTGQCVTVNDLTPQSTYNFKILRETNKVTSVWSDNLIARTFSSGIGEKSLVFGTGKSIVQINVTGHLMAHIEAENGPVREVIALGSTVFYTNTHAQLFSVNLSGNDISETMIDRESSFSVLCVEANSRQLLIYSRDEKLIRAARIYVDGLGEWRSVAEQVTGDVLRLTADSRSGILYWTTNTTISAVYMSGSSQSVVFQQSQMEIRDAAICSDNFYWLVKRDEAITLYSHKLLPELPAEEWTEENIKSTALWQNSAQLQEIKSFLILEGRIIFPSLNAGLMVHDLTTGNMARLGEEAAYQSVTAISLVNPSAPLESDHYLPNLFSASQVQLTESEVGSNGSVYTITWPKADSGREALCMVQYKNLVMKTQNNSVSFRGNLPASSDVPINTFCETRWFRSSVKSMTLRTPPKPPSSPTLIRIFSQASDQTGQEKTWTVLIRWSHPKQPRGIIQRYNVQVLDGSGKHLHVASTEPIVSIAKCAGEVRLDGLVDGDRYRVKVQAENDAGEGEWAVHEYLAADHPLVELVLLTSGEARGQQLLLVDYDSGGRKKLDINQTVTDVAVDSNLRQLYLLYLSKEVWRYDLQTSSQVMIFRNSAKILQISFDWIGGHIYYTQQREQIQLYRRWVLGSGGKSEKLTIGSQFQHPASMMISPIARTLVWTERRDRRMNVYSWSMDSLSEQQLFLPHTNERCDCKTRFSEVSILGAANSGMKVLLNTNLVETDMIGCQCSTIHQFKRPAGLKVLSSAESIYWTRRGSDGIELTSMKIHSLFSEKNVHDDPLVVMDDERSKITNGWVIDRGLQPYPSETCPPLEIRSINVICISSKSAEIEFDVKSQAQGNCLVPQKSFPVRVEVVVRTEGSQENKNMAFQSLDGLILTNLQSNTKYFASVKIYDWRPLFRETEPQKFQTQFTTATTGLMSLRAPEPVINRQLGVVVWKPACSASFHGVSYQLQTASLDKNIRQWKNEYSGNDTKWKIVAALPNAIFRLGVAYDGKLIEFKESSEMYNPTKVGLLRTDEVSHGTPTFIVWIFVILLVAAIISFLYFRSNGSRFLKICTGHKAADGISERQLAEYTDIMEANGTESVKLTQLNAFPTSLMRATNGLYESLSLDSASLGTLAKLPRDQLIVKTFLGRGAFGQVFEGLALLNSPKDDSQDEWCRVAVKTLAEGSRESEKSAFMKEAWLMSSFCHAHVLSPRGVCVDGEPYFLLMELMEGGDLLSFLRNHRNYVNDGFGQFTLADRIQTVLDVACGCSYLEDKHFVHRDLAARNCLVTMANLDGGRRLLVKIGDFGLTRDVYDNDYYRKSGEGPLPIRWMSPEALIDGVFTSKSDVWAFGVLILEVLSNGEQPFPGRSNTDVLKYVRAGGIPETSDALQIYPLQFSQLMQDCWRFNPESRVTFARCVTILSQMQQEHFDQGISNATTVHNAQYSVISRNPNTPAPGTIWNQSTEPGGAAPLQKEEDSEIQMAFAKSAAERMDERLHISPRAGQHDHPVDTDQPAPCCDMQSNDKVSKDLENVHFSF